MYYVQLSCLHYNYKIFLGSWKKKRNKTNKCVWLLSIYCGFLFYSANLICSFVEVFIFFSTLLSFLAPLLEAIHRIQPPDWASTMSVLPWYVLVVGVGRLASCYWVCVPCSCCLPQRRVHIL